MDHPEISNEEIIKETLENPTKITQPYGVRKHYYYKYSKDRKSPDKFLMVIVKYLNENVWLYRRFMSGALNKMNKKTRLYYDEEGDFLEISVGEPTECYAEEIEPGVFVRIDNQTGEVKSISILDFLERTQSKDIEFNVPIGFDFSKIKEKLSSH